MILPNLLRVGRLPPPSRIPLSRHHHVADILNKRSVRKVRFNTARYIAVDGGQNLFTKKPNTTIGEPSNS